ncbi:MAG: tetratricopeptide repeat protein [Bacteroidota bacterium]|nr:tetratricopeptide repeat protein [Bacteroidota bacterium]
MPNIENNIFQNINPDEHIRFLFVRTDELRDNIISLPMLKAIKQKYINSQISVVCQKHLAELYSKNPSVDTIIVFEKGKFIEDEEYRKTFIKKLQRIEYNVSINPVFSRDPLTDYIALGCNAPLRIAFEGDLMNISPEAKFQNDQFYIQLVNVDESCISEIERYKLFLKDMNIEADNLLPELLLDEASVQFADKYFNDNELTVTDTIVMFPFDDYGLKSISNIGEIIKSLPQYKFLFLSTEVIDNEINSEINSLSKSGRTFNLIGQTSIQQAIALTQKASLVITADNSSVHIACAVNTKNIVISGGGQFGRYYPYSNLTSVLALPLDCYGCKWECKFSERYCLTSLDDNFLIESITRAVQTEISSKPRVYVKTIFNKAPGTPEWEWFNHLVNADDVELISFDQLPDSLDVDELLLQSEKEIAEGNYTKAKNILNSILTENPDQLDILNNLVVVEILEKNYEKAGQLLSKILSIDPNNDVAIENTNYLELQLVLYNSLLEAENCIKVDNFDEARQILTKIIETDNTYSDAINDLTVIDILEQNYDDAYAKINKVFELDPGNQAASENLSFLKEMINLRNKQLQV